MSKLLHVYGPEVWHDEVIVIGNRAGLEALRGAVNRALADGYSETGDDDCLFVNDGEGFTLHTLLVDGDWDHETWVNLAAPYTDKTAQDKRSNAIQAGELIREQMETR